MLVQDPDLPGGERVKILDFGVAKIAENLGALPMNTRTGIEQLRALEKDPQAVVTEPVVPATHSAATEVHGVVAAPTVRAPFVRAAARPAWWLALLLLALLLVWGMVFLLQSAGAADRPGVEVRHPAAGSSHVQEALGKKSTR